MFDLFLNDFLYLLQFLGREVCIFSRFQVICQLGNGARSMMTLVTRSSFNSQASDISARVCPREAATSLSA